MATFNVGPEEASATIEQIVSGFVEKIDGQLVARAYRVSNELTNATAYVLRGQRSGRTYRVPGTRRNYTASAPGEPPAVRTGAFRGSWKRRVVKEGNVVKAITESDLRVGKKKYLLGALLEEGTRRTAPRPYKKKVIDRAYPRAVKIYNEPYIR